MFSRGQRQTFAKAHKKCFENNDCILYSSTALSKMNYGKESKWNSDNGHTIFCNCIKDKLMKLPCSINAGSKCRLVFTTQFVLIRRKLFIRRNQQALHYYRSRSLLIYYLLIFTTHKGSFKNKIDIMQKSADH